MTFSSKNDACSITAASESKSVTEIKGKKLNFELSFHLHFIYEDFTSLRMSLKASLSCDDLL